MGKIRYQNRYVLNKSTYRERKINEYYNLQQLLTWRQREYYEQDLYRKIVPIDSIDLYESSLYPHQHSEEHQAWVEATITKFNNIYPTLTKKQKQVVDLILQDCPTKKIAEHIGMDSKCDIYKYINGSGKYGGLFKKIKKQYEDYLLFEEIMGLVDKGYSQQKIGNKLGIDKEKVRSTIRKWKKIKLNG
jgi:DNA-binding CsgD family transcriptional regulator